MKPELLTARRFFVSLATCLALIAIVIVLSPGIGTQSRSVGLVRAWRSWSDPSADPVANQIAFALRLPRTLLALQVGITLALCGAIFQVLFRNALATPYTLGISSGGSLGALIAIKFGWQAVFFGISSVSVASFAGALFVIGVVIIFTRGSRRLTTNELLLAGVTMGLFCSAMMMMVTYLSNARETFEIIRWMMGSLDTIGNFSSLSLLPLVLPAWIVLPLFARRFNQYALGDELAASRGVNVRTLQIVSILVASLATAGVVAICGPIGFVGLLVPHMTALAFGRDCRILLPASALVGGVFLAVCDWLSQLTLGWAGAISGRQLGNAILPIGVVTAVVGVPLFLILLHRRAGNAELD